MASGNLFFTCHFLSINLAHLLFALLDNYVGPQNSNVKGDDTFNNTSF